jgi:hypothetical protein
MKEASGWGEVISYAVIIGLSLTTWGGYLLGVAALVCLVGIIVGVANE